MEKKYSIEEIGSRIKSIPLIDKSIFDIIALLNNPDTTYEAIAKKLPADLTVRFLNMANMAAYGREVRSIGHAVRLLGFKEMKNILISSLLIDHLVRRLDLNHFSFDKFQIQAHFCGAVSRILAQILNFSGLEDLFTVSVLHNIGKLIIVVYFDEEHRRINALKQEKNIRACEAEAEVLGATHSQIGAMVLERLNIPKDICDTVRFHDDLDRKISDSNNYELEFIFRTAAGIVGTLPLPEAMEPMELVGRMANSIARGREKCLAETRHGMRSRGYEKVFPRILADASELVTKDLREIIGVR